MWKSVLVVLLIALTMHGETQAEARLASSGRMRRVGPDTIGNEPGDLGYRPSLSANGRYVAFTSRASDLVADDTNGCTDVFVYDRYSGTMERVTVNSLGQEADGASGSPSISADGRFVAFVSWACNLAPEIPCISHQDVFVHDRETRTTSLVSVTLTGGYGHGHRPTISADGRFVAYNSGGTGLVINDTNNRWDVFVRDIDAGETIRVSLGPDGNQLTDDSHSEPTSMSADGRYVVFQAGVTKYCHDQELGKSIIIGAHRDANWPRISGNGRYVALDLGQAGGFAILIYDLDLQRQTALIERAGAPDYSGNPPRSGLSYDGRYVVFDGVDGPIAGDTNGWRDIVLFDTATSRRSIASTGLAGGQANGESSDACISADGRIVAFVSHASNLVANDTNAVADLFVFDGTNYSYSVYMPDVLSE